ncbi:MAG: DUF4339 domain-containing protein [Oscillatoriaceae cyanobacterium Prado104]|jgi:hypothetical protein|nr:DUF4339 domain-containing protein [Oscillatoriaceae cyanobacterium Prado104]
MNNWPKFLPHPVSWARGLALSSSFWLIVSVLLPKTYYYYYGFTRTYWNSISNSDFESAISFAWFCLIQLFTFYHWLLTKATEWVENRRQNQPPNTVSAWLHWKEGIIAFATLPAAIVLGIPAMAILILPFRDSAAGIVALILGTAIASAYLYHFRFARLLKFILKFFWLFYTALFKVLQITLVPAATGTPFFIFTIATAESVPKQLLPLTTFLLVVCVLLSGIVGYAVLQYWSAHLVNWVGTWWPVGAPGYGRIQARKAWKHNKTAMSQSFIHHSTSWHLAANDATYLIYFKLMAIGCGAIGYWLFGEPSEWSETQEEMLGTVTALSWVALWHFSGWRREVAIASDRTSSKTSANTTSANTTSANKRSSNVDLPAPDAVEIELNQMSADLGNTRMRSVRKSQPATQKTPPANQKRSTATQQPARTNQKLSAPTQKPKSEQPQWYVFRSGQAEGPYTKNQLRDIQKITDRTKVRLGESEWLRAGEIPELAAYLTEK